MVNEVRGEREVTLGTKTYVVALTAGALAALEKAFGVENFEDAFTKIARVVEVEGGAGKTRFFPIASNVLKLWTTIIEANGGDASALEKENINQYAAALLAFDLLQTTRETWFGADSPAGDGRPLADAPAGATG